MVLEGDDGVRVWNTHQLKELATPAQFPQVHGPISCVRWMITPYEQYKTLCFGTALGYFVFWRQEAEGRFVEFFDTRLGRGGKILDITLDMANKDHVRFAVGTSCGSIQIWKYECNGLLNILNVVTIETMAPRKVAFAYNDNIVWIFGFYGSQMYVQTSLQICCPDESWIRYAMDIETGDIVETNRYPRVV
jgi:hypothetical protein